VELDKVMVFDVSGKLILEKKNIQKRINIFRYKCTKTAFIVSVFLINGTTVSKKIIY
jgi:hypothetical protein